MHGGSPSVDQCSVNSMLSQPDDHHDFSGSWKRVRNLTPESHLALICKKLWKI